MNKDAILASIIGFGIGLLITGGVIVGPRLLSQLKRSQSGDVASATSQQNSTITPTPESAVTNETLVIENPQKEAVLHESSTSVSGKAPKNATLIIASTEDETIIQTNDTTTYQAAVTLKEGKNDISVVSIVNGKSAVERITVYYTPNK